MDAGAADLERYQMRTGPRCSSWIGGTNSITGAARSADHRFHIHARVLTITNVNQVQLANIDLSVRD